MEQEVKNTLALIAELLKGIPHPGEILIESAKNNATEYSLRPKSIPQRISGVNRCFRVNLQIIRKDKPFGDGSLYLDLVSKEWEEWIKQKPDFTIRTEDVGREIWRVEEREKNFSRNLLHEFLDKHSPIIDIDHEDYGRILDNDNYPFYFWDNPVTVSGACRSHGEMLTISIRTGFETSGIIGIDRSFRAKYWELLSEEKAPLMKIVLKWHKALISLYHLIKRDGVNLPIDCKKMRQICREEIQTVLPDFEFK